MIISKFKMVSFYSSLYFFTFYMHLRFIAYIILFKHENKTLKPPKTINMKMSELSSLK